MGGSQSLPTLLGGNLNARGLGNSITAEGISTGLNLDDSSGGTSGFGAECARVLAKRGVHVVLAARREQACQEVKSDIGLAESPISRLQAGVQVMPLKLANLGTVRKFTEESQRKNLPLNTLMKSEGVFCKQFATADEGVELKSVTYVLGQITLTMFLLDNLKKTLAEGGTEGRIMFTGRSGGHGTTSRGGIGSDSLVSCQLGKIGYQVSKPFIKKPEERPITLVFAGTHAKLKGVTGTRFSDTAEIRPGNSASRYELSEKSTCLIGAVAFQVTHKVTFPKDEVDSLGQAQYFLHFCVHWFRTAVALVIKISNEICNNFGSMSMLEMAPHICNVMKLEVISGLS